MSASCHGFVENAWRKGVCTNCFRLRDEHEISVSGSGHLKRYGTNTKASNNFTNNPSMITTSISSGGGIKNTGVSLGYGVTRTASTSGIYSRSSVSGGLLPSKSDTNINTIGIGNLPRNHNHYTKAAASGGLSNTNSNKSYGNVNMPTLTNVTQYGYGFSHGTDKSSGGSVVGGKSNVTFSAGLVSNYNSGDSALTKKRMEKKDFTDSGGSGGGRRPNFSVGGRMRSSESEQKGILKSKKGTRNKKMSVSFPEEVVKVIGYGDDGPGNTSSDEDDTPLDPQDSSSIAELLEKNSTTLDEKEFYRLTQKNTNFNSIKTNLLGKTNIELGPIVGGTGGSMKPLVSIGTFETRNEPLKIRKKIDEDSDDYDKTVSSHRKFVTTTSASSTPTASTTTSKPPINTNSITNPGGSGNITTTKNSAQVPDSSNLKMQTTKPTTTPISNIKTGTNATTNLESLLSKRLPPEPSKPITISKIIPSKPLVTISAATDQTKFPISSKPKPIVNYSTKPGAESKNEIKQGSSNKDPGTFPIYAQVVKPKPKSILKNSQTLSTSTIPPIPTSKVPELPKSPSPSSTSPSRSSNALTNLIIFTEGNNIASKRTSFLKDLIQQGDKPTSTSAASNSLGVTIVNTTGASMESQPSLEKDSLETPAPKPDQTETESKAPQKVPLPIKLNLSLNCEVTNPPQSLPIKSIIGSSDFKNFNGTGSGTDSEFDDSLEDSGLDIKSRTRSASEEAGSLSEESDENEKGLTSGSDSGNENDYTVTKICNNFNRTNSGNPNLYISVEDDDLGEESLKLLSVKKPAKLSPDSVLFSSANGSVSGSEMSQSGSNESIPESLSGIRDRRGSCNGGNSSSTSTSTSTLVISSPTTNSKRQAPLPPEDNKISSPDQELYSTIDQESDQEGVYDDVSNLKNYNASNSNDFDQEESIYDDCTTNTTSANATGKIGSYNFQDSLGETNEDSDPVIATRSDGIEFIGIRKIDSESFLRERSPSPEKRFGLASRRSSSPGKSSRERSSSTSPKARRKVNQFFSTIGKKAGAAFNNSQLAQYARNKSPSALVPNESPQDKGYNYRRSMSSDEVSASRAQEIYATLTPTSLKFKGFAPVLNKLSKIDLTMNDKNSKDKNKDSDESDHSSKDKMFKKNNKISTSIKKFLRFGNKEDANLYSTSTSPPSNISAPYNPSPSCTSDDSNSNSLEDSKEVKETKEYFPQPQGPRKPSIPSGKPPPPPPRVHSLDLLHKVGVMGPHGTVKPARPPPPVRSNKIAPSFTQVFNNPGSTSGQSPSPNLSGPQSGSGSEDGLGVPPCKPRRKNSMNCSGGSRDLETSYNHITSLNLETLKLIANQPLTKITSKTSNLPKPDSDESVHWSQFDIQTGLRPDPIIHGVGYAFYSAHFEGTKCLLLIQECTSAPGFSAPFQFPCVQTDLTFQDIVPSEFIPWEASDYVKVDSGIKAIISVLPFLSLVRLEDFIKSQEIPQKEKYLALLQSLEYWDIEKLSDLLVLKQPSPLSPHRSSSDSDLPSNLIFIHPIPQFTTLSKGRRSTSKSRLHTDFEVSVKQLLFTSEDYESFDNPEHTVLSELDKQILIQKVSGNREEVRAQLKLFFQLKLFAPQKDSGESLKIRKYRSEQAIQQWLDKERAQCMKEAVERSLNGGSLGSDSISPFKKSYLEFLMRPGNSAKAILDMFVELFE